MAGSEMIAGAQATADAEYKKYNRYAKFLTRHYTVADGKDGRERMTRGGLLQMMSSIRNSNASERISCRSKLGRDPVSIMGMELGRVG